MKSMKRISFQLAKEFALPALAALGFTLYRYVETPMADRHGFSLLDTFGARVFFFSWLFSQFFRVAKQQATEDSLSSIERRVGDAMNQLETRTAEILRNITGGTSRLDASAVVENDVFTLSYWAIGDVPLVDVSIKISLLTSVTYDPATPQSISYSQAMPYMEEEHVPVLHTLDLRPPIRFAVPAEDQFGLLVELGAKNGRRQQFYLFKAFPENVHKWVYRRYDFERPGSTPTVTNYFCSGDDWDFVRPLTVQEMVASNAAAEADRLLDASKT